MSNKLVSIINAVHKKKSPSKVQAWQDENNWGAISFDYLCDYLLQEDDITLDGKLIQFVDETSGPEGEGLVLQYEGTLVMVDGVYNSWDGMLWNDGDGAHEVEAYEVTETRYRRK